MGLDKKPKYVEMQGRLWTDMYGNTYHVVDVYVSTGSITTKGNSIKLTSGINYGYGNQFEYTGLKLLEANGIMPRLIKKALDTNQVPWRFFQENGIKFRSIPVDVKRKKDL